MSDGIIDWNDLSEANRAKIARQIFMPAILRRDTHA